LPDATTSDVTRVQPRTRVVTGPDDECARSFVERHRRLYIGADLVRYIVAFSDAAPMDRPAAKSVFDARRSRWEREGGFVEMVSGAQVSTWLSSGDTLLVEVAAPGSGVEDPFVAVAQRLFRIPRADWVIKLLDGPNDEIWDEPAYASILAAGPACAVGSDYLGVLPEWAGLGLAAEARRRGRLALAALNEERPREAQLACVVGEIFAVQGVDVLGARGEVQRSVLLQDLDEDEITNRISVRANRASRQWPAEIIGKRGCDSGIPVVLDGQRYRLRVDWYYVKQLVAKTRADERSSVT